MGRRLEYEVKTSVRLNMSNPQHVKINDVIQNLDPKIFKSKNQFIIDAIQFYIDNYGKETFVIKKKEKERAEYIRSEDIEDIKEEVIEVATNEATVIGPNVKIENELRLYIDSIIKLEKVQTDLNKIMYFVDIVSSYKGYCFIVDAGMQYLFVNGKVDENINSCFQKTRTMQAKLDVLKPISGIREVFAHFIVECVYKKDNYNICFDYLSGKVKAEIKEQDLRNILLQYLEKNMRGEVSVEFCTDYLNDEESVDIYIYDGCQRAIIEVKFSLPEKYYAGSTHYSITARTGDGIKQLDKYARHLAKDGRLVDFGYVYMFYMSDVKKETLMSRIDNKTNELLRGLSDELNSIFDGVEMNDMKCWGTAS